jgi:hypothetical protein
VVLGKLLVQHGECYLCYQHSPDDGRMQVRNRVVIGLCTNLFFLHIYKYKNMKICWLVVWLMGLIFHSVVTFTFCIFKICLCSTQPYPLRTCKRGDVFEVPTATVWDHMFISGG